MKGSRMERRRKGRGKRKGREGAGIVAVSACSYDAGIGENHRFVVEFCGFLRKERLGRWF